MILNVQGIALATRCLWSLQEAAPEIDGLLFTRVDGLTLTSTFNGNANMQRLAAISTTLFLLSEQAAEAWGSGEAMEVQMVLSFENRSQRFVTIKPVGHQAVLTAVYSSSSRNALIKTDIDLAATYLLAILAGDTPPYPVNWRSR